MQVSGSTWRQVSRVYGAPAIFAFYSLYRLSSSLFRLKYRYFQLNAPIAAFYMFPEMLASQKCTICNFQARSINYRKTSPSLTNRELAVASCRLAHSALFALLLISLAGDVSLNPGPVTPPSLSVRDFTQCRGLKIAHWNIRSVYPKLDSLKLWLLNQPFDVLTLSETWLKPSIRDREIQIPGYSCVRSDRLHKAGGGTMAYVRDGIPYRLRPDIGASLPESCVIEISRPKCNLQSVWHKLWNFIYWRFK